MAKLHNNKVVAADLLPVITTFLATCRSPAVVEEGDSPLSLAPGSYQIEVRGGRLCLEASSETRLLSRRITSINEQRPGILDCVFQRFGGVDGKITFLDLDRPQTAYRQLTAVRRSFSEQFRRMLRRQFPQWEVTVLTSSMDLRRSFSPVFPRAVLRHGQHVIAALACPSSAAEGEFLTFALLWFHHVSNDTRASLCLFLPAASGTLTAHRLRWLRRDLLQPKLFLFNTHGAAGEVDPQDLGNLQTRVSAHYVPVHLSPALQALVDRLLQLPHINVTPELSGAVRITFQGAEFARIEHGGVQLGLGETHSVAESDFDSVWNFALQLLDLNVAPRLPERWLEGATRANLCLIHSDLLAEPVHGQVLTFAGLDRDAIDLLAVSSEGRLTLLELKVEEDLHLPLQALDYWMRVKWHSERQELAHLFPAVSLCVKAPRLVLLAPALSFHSTNATVLRYFSSEIEIERVGVNSDWKTRFKVVLRLAGAETPISHGRS